MSTDARGAFLVPNMQMVRPIDRAIRFEPDHQGPDSFTLVYVDLLQRMVSHTVRLVATAELKQDHSRPPVLGGIINLPNPLKVLGATRFGAPTKAESTELFGRMKVDGQVELGVIPLEGAIVGNRTILTNDGRRAIFWTESRVTVGTLMDPNAHVFTRCRLFRHSPTVSRRSGLLRCLLSTPGGSIKIHLC